MTASGQSAMSDLAAEFARAMSEGATWCAAHLLNETTGDLL